MTVQSLLIENNNYPKNLKNIFDPPKELFYLGNLENSKMISVVGTRDMTLYGEEITAKLVSSFVQNGYTIVSGMALGIDGVAHRVAIDCGGKTIAVLGAGVDIIYPPQHKDLYNSILSSGGAIISEVSPGKTVAKQMFPARNRIISGLSEGVVVIESAIKSGSLITARLALEQGREVFAVPGSPGTDYLIDQGARGILEFDGKF